jgi:hypothetical protein
VSDDPITELLARLRALDVKVWVEGDRLRCSAPRGILTDTLRAELAARKGELLQRLAATDDTPRVAKGASDEDVAPLSFSQQRLCSWTSSVLERLSTTSPARLGSSARSISLPSCEPWARSSGDMPACGPSFPRSMALPFRWFGAPLPWIYQCTT